MKILDPDLLAEFRNAVRCEWCRRPNGDGLDPHHLYGRGMGGGNRLDIRLNLLSLCRVCHQEFHDGQIPRFSLLAIVAFRENMLQDRIEEIIHRIRRLPKDAGMDAVQAIYDELGYTGPRRCTTAEIVIPWAFYQKERRA